MSQTPSGRDAVGILGRREGNGGNLGPITPFGQECECQGGNTNLEPIGFVDDADFFRLVVVVVVVRRR